jgi:molecular chaperone GrpE (heat shock protein)
MPEVENAPRLPKWPFYLADLVLSGIAAYVLVRLGVIQGTTGTAISVACLGAAAFGAWLSITPWLTEFRTRSSIAENTNLKSTLEQIQGLEKVADLIRQANAQWQSVQDASGRTVTAAREITDKMKIETDEFMKFIENAHDQERAGLRLEVDKLRKMEGDWVKVTVQMLDHVFALFRAAERSGQENLVAQLSQFQNACRDVARRMGLVPFVPMMGEKYDPRGHQLANPPPVVDENATIGEVLATGYTYQGGLLRRSLVLLSEKPETAQPPPVAPEPQEPVRNRIEETPVFADSPVMTEEAGEMSASGGDFTPTQPAATKTAQRASDPEAQDELPLL